MDSNYELLRAKGKQQTEKGYKMKIALNIRGHKNEKKASKQ